MGLPDLIEIVPLKGPVRAEITVPGSKSITNRALVLAALANGETTLKGALWSEDTQIMVDCLRKLGFKIEVTQDPEEFCNRTIVVDGQGLGGKIPNAGTEEKPLELFVGNAGTAARFLSAFVCLGNGVYRIYGIPRMNERPKAALFQALRELGYRVESPSEKLPALIYGQGPKPGAKCTVDIGESSQFASALLLCAETGGWKITVTGENDEESPYVAMTSKLIKAFKDRRVKNFPPVKRWDPWKIEPPPSSCAFQIEPDASSGSYFLAAGRFAKFESMEHSEQLGVKVPTVTSSNTSIANWPDSGWQIDERFSEYLQYGSSFSKALAEIKRTDTTNLVAAIKENEAYFENLTHPRISRTKDLGDSIMTLIAVAPLGKSIWGVDSVTFTDLGRLRLQETERVVALRTELTKCGAKVEELGDTLTVYPSELHGAEIETYNDHRMAMCFAILGLKIPGIKIKNPACVKKTFPNFFQKLAARPPKGLGVTIQDAKTGKVLSHDELFAD